MENQNIEWKESWRDEYLKWICGFANAQGGHLEIGRNGIRSIPHTPLIAGEFFRSTAEKLAEAIGITKRRIEANISKLKDLGIIERIGADKNGYWVVKGK